MLRLIGVPELIAADGEAYVELALRVAGDAAYRAALAERIGAGWGRLVNRSEPIAALADALVAMVERRP
jgi:predicted O-linked N-acetylglucosamine transferase (SPINDLY family)